MRRVKDVPRNILAGSVRGEDFDKQRDKIDDQRGDKAYHAKPVTAKPAPDKLAMRQRNIHLAHPVDEWFFKALRKILCGVFKRRGIRPRLQGIGRPRAVPLGERLIAARGFRRA